MVLDGEQDKPRIRLLQQGLVLFLAIEVADESLTVLLNVILGGSLGLLDDRLGRSSSLELGKESGLGSLLGGVEVNVCKGRSSNLGRGLDGSHCVCIKGW